MTHSPPSSAADLTPQSREKAAAAFEREDAPEAWLKDKARLAILSPPGLLVSASPAMLALFGAKDREALEARLVQGDGPSARRLRRLAATFAFDEAPRLEQMRLMVGRRLASVNLHCARMAGPRGASWLLVTAPALGAASDEPLAPANDRETPQSENVLAPDLGEKPAPHAASPPSPNARFLWTLDEEGRFGGPHPVLVAAVGTNAPERGELLEAFFRRVGMDGGDELARVVGEQETFSRVTLEWPWSGLDRRRLIALSAAPMFGRQREFLGYRGFGVLCEEIDAVAMPEDNLPAELAADESIRGCLRRSNPSLRRPKARRGRSNRVRNLPARIAPSLRLSSMRMELAPPAPRRSNPNALGRQASLNRRSSRPKTSESRSRGILSFHRPMSQRPAP